LYNHSQKQKKVHGIVIKAEPSSRKITVLLDHKIDHAYRREGNKEEVDRIERTKIQHLRDCIFPGIPNDLIRIDQGGNKWSWALLDPESPDLRDGKKYVVICRPAVASDAELQEYRIILDYFRLLCYLPAVQRLNYTLSVQVLYDRMYKGRIIGASPNHKYIIFSPSSQDWDSSDYQYIKTTDPTFPVDVGLLSAVDMDKKPPPPLPLVLLPLFHEIDIGPGVSNWSDVARLMKTGYHDIVRQLGKTSPEDIVTLGARVNTSSSSAEMPRFCITMRMMHECAITVEMKRFGQANMHYISDILTSATATVPRYTKPPLVYIEEPSIKTSPNDSIQAMAVCDSVDERKRPGRIVLTNPGLYRKEFDDPSIVPPKVFLIPSTFNDCKTLPIKLEIFPIDKKLGCQPHKDSDIKNSYLVEVVYTPPPSARTKMEVKTLGWFVSIEKYFDVKKSFRQMLQYTVDGIAVELGVDVIHLDDQSYISIYGLTNDMINRFNSNPEQLEPLKEDQGESQNDERRKPRPMLHPPFYKVLRPMSKGNTLYTEMGFVCLPKIFLDAVDTFLETRRDHPQSLDIMINLMNVLSQTVGMLIQGLATSIPIDNFMTQEEIEIVVDLLQKSAKKRKSDGSVSKIVVSTTIDMAASFITLFREHSASKTEQEYDRKMNRLIIWDLYSRFSRQVFTHEKKWIRDMNDHEGQRAYFNLYMNYVLHFITINEEEEAEEWTSEKLLMRLSDIRAVMGMDRAFINFIIGNYTPKERIKMLRVLLWGYNSVFASTRMYRNASGLFQFRL